MYRVVSLLVVLAHLGVASTPCFETGVGFDRLLASADRDSRLAAAPFTGQDEHATHPAAAAAVKGAHAELRSTCICGGSKGTDSAGTSPRLGFALIPADPAVLPDAVASVEAPATYGMPALLADPFDHVPILFS
jgi:hypothetical protein